MNAKVKTKISEAQFLKKEESLHLTFNVLLEVKLQTKSMCLAGRCVNLILYSYIVQC